MTPAKTRTRVLCVLATLALLWAIPESYTWPITTWAISMHEMGHAFAALLTGGSLDSIEMGSHHGVAWTRGGWYPIISMAGYTFTAWLTVLFWCASASPGPWTRRVLYTTLVLCALGLTVWGAWLSVGLWIGVGVTLLWLAVISRDTTGLATAFGSGLLGYEQMKAMTHLLWSSPGQTDANLLAHHWGLPFLAWPLAVVYSFLPLLLLAGYLRLRSRFVLRQGQIHARPEM